MPLINIERSENGIVDISAIQSDPIFKNIVIVGGTFPSVPTNNNACKNCSLIISIILL